MAWMCRRKRPEGHCGVVLISGCHGRWERRLSGTRGPSSHPGVGQRGLRPRSRRATFSSVLISPGACAGLMPCPWVWGRGRESAEHGTGKLPPLCSPAHGAQTPPAPASCPLPLALMLCVMPSVQERGEPGCLPSPANTVLEPQRASQHAGANGQTRSSRIPCNPWEQSWCPRYVVCQGRALQNGALRGILLFYPRPIQLVPSSVPWCIKAPLTARLHPAGGALFTFSPQPLDPAGG